MAPRSTMTSEQKAEHAVVTARVRQATKTYPTILRERHDQLLIKNEKLKAFGRVKDIKEGNEGWERTFELQDEIRQRFTEVDSDEVRANYKTKMTGVSKKFGVDDVQEYRALCEEFLSDPTDDDVITLTEVRKLKKTSANAAKQKKQKRSGSDAGSDRGSITDKVAEIGIYCSKHGVKKVREMFGTLGFGFGTLKSHKIKTETEQSPEHEPRGEADIFE